MLVVGAALFLATPQEVSAKTCTSTASGGNWNDASTWTCGGTPLTSDDVVIRSGASVQSFFTPITINSITIEPGATLNLLLASMTIRGNLLNNGTLNNMWQTTNFNGAAPQTIAGASPTTFYDLAINNSNGVSLQSNATVSNTLTLTSGRLSLGGSTLTLGTAATVSGAPSASRMVVADGTGRLCKRFSGAGAFTFPIGDATGTPEYSPARLNFTSGAFGGGAQACVRVTDEKHPYNGLDNDFITRYWSLSQTGITNFSCSLNMTYVNADIVGAEASLLGVRFSGGVWTALPPVNAASNAITGVLTGFSDITAARVGPTSANINYFHAWPTDAGIELAWETVSEATTAGFNLYRREPGGEFVQINGALIPPQMAGQPLGAVYTYLDAGTSPDLVYEYKLEIIETSLLASDSVVVTCWPRRLWLPLIMRD